MSVSCAIDDPRQIDAMIAELSLDPNLVMPDETLGSAMTYCASSVAVPSNPLPLIAISAGGDIEVKQALADGGMGRVSVGWQRALEREVAVKTLLPELQT